MYVCLCNQVKDSDIANAVAHGAQSFNDIQAMTGAGTCCGQCGDEAKAITDNLVQQSLFHSAA